MIIVTPCAFSPPAGPVEKAGSRAPARTLAPWIPAFAGMTDNLLIGQNSFLVGLLGREYSLAMCSENFKLNRPRASLGIQARLVILTLATVLPLVVLAGFAVLRTVDDQRQQIERDVRERVASLLAAVDREISNVQSSLRILGRSPSLQAGDLKAFAT